jgi:exopolyphosphatase/guanosine-5'-triphosphate,3'-diphosphate pyrophosphatase
MKTKTLAGIDIGTNTFRLLIAEVNSKGLKKIRSERIITRLGEGVSETHLLKEEAIHRGIIALKKFNEIISLYPVDAITAVATSALREARNKDIFLKRTKETTGLDIKILDEKEEARKTCLGMMMDMPIPESALMVDIGGGSTEFIFVKKGKPLFIHSLNIGVVYLSEKYMKNDPPTEEEIKKMDMEISQEITSLKEPLKKFLSEETVFIGTAGTITTLSAMTQGLHSFDHNKVHNSMISLNSVKEIFSDISKKTMQQRAKKYPVLESPRLDIIVPGTLILLKIMMIFGFKEVFVSDNGLREGILLDLYNEFTT